MPHRVDADALYVDGREFAPQVAHVHIQATVQPGIGPMQHVLIKERLGQRFSGVLVERAQQAEFRGGEPGRDAVETHVPRLAVECQCRSTRSQRRRARAAIYRHTAQQGVDAHIQFRQAERLGQVVIGALAEPGDAVLLGAQGRHQNHRRTTLMTQAREDGQPTFVGQHDVQQNQLHWRMQRHVQPLVAAMAAIEAEPTPAQVIAQVRAQFHVILNDENARAGR
ncbi:hypothetical protein BHE74_00010214 [Ensete ventricosum]|nr:hypothetical protein BHE74_00010214 [Ensete ventricosum]